MLLFGHIGVTLGIFVGTGLFIPRLRTIIDPRYLVIGAILPDLIDKPLGRFIFASTFANGRIFGHTLLFSLALLTIGVYLYDKRKDIRVLTLATGSFFHLMEDQMWVHPQTLLWPLLGLYFPKGNIDDTGLEYMLRMFEQSFKPELSPAFVPEILGMVVILILILYWLIDRLYKPNSKGGKKV